MVFESRPHVQYLSSCLPELFLPNMCRSICRHAFTTPKHYYITPGMKTLHMVVFTLVLLAASLFVPLQAPSQGFLLQSRAAHDETPSGLPLRTQWGQREVFARFSPGNFRLGCWSTAIAQILYYHRLVPSGSVEYTTSTGYHIDEDFDATTFDWSRFVNVLDDNTPEASINEVTRYVYYVATVIQKDYDTGSYVLRHAERAEAVSQHYECTATVYKSSTHSMEQLKNIIINEINSNRPLMMHLRDLDKDLYHAVVVDGYENRDGIFFVHINMGHQGDEDGWYDFDAPILDYDDPSYKKFMVIVPAS